jgi:chromate transporter
MDRHDVEPGRILTGTSLPEPETAGGSSPETPPAPPLGEAFRFWVKLGFISFGGPTGQIAIMHHELVERRRWISEARFLHALNYCMLLPGPEAQQLAIYVGWLLHRALGGILAGAFFVIPSVFVLWAITYVYARFGQVPWIAATFYGLKPAVTAIVAYAVIRIGRRALKNAAMWAIAALAFVAIFFLDVPFPLIVLGAGILGLIGGLLRRETFLVAASHGGAEGGTSLLPAAPVEPASVLGDQDASPAHARPSRGRALRVAAICLVLWWAPVALAGLSQGTDGTIFREGVFFSKAAMVTFGGAYAVLPYVAQKAVEDYGWLSAAQMLDGLGLAETTPGPLIMVVQFVGFMGGWNHPGDLSPLVAASLGALITTWVTFLPSFLWIFLGAPHVESLRGNERLSSALSAITAAVVGVVLNLAVWFGLHVFFPEAGGVDVLAVLIAAVAFAGMLTRGWGIVPVVLGGALVGLAHGLAVGR